MEIKDLSLEKFHLLNNVPTGICVIDYDYKIVFWNNCIETWTNISYEDILGKPLHSVSKSFLEKRYTSRIDPILSGGPPTIFSSQLHGYLFPSRLPNGTQRILQTTVSCVSAKEKNRYYALFSLQDLTELSHRIVDFQKMQTKALKEIERRKKIEEEKEKIIDDLEKAMEQIKTLRGIIPICSYCKEIRDDKGSWNKLEKYISEHSEAQFSHGICDNCLKEHYPELGS